MRQQSVVMKFLFMILVSQPVLLQAQSYTCSGPVSGVTLSPTGLVAAETVAGINWPYICQMGANYNGVTPEGCKAIYATLMTAQLTQKDVMFWFSDNATCNTHPQWGPLTGWYFGPKLVP
jgi:hypothetical protein